MATTIVEGEVQQSRDIRVRTQMNDNEVIRAFLFVPSLFRNIQGETLKLEFYPNRI